MKKYILLLAVVFLLAGCSNSNTKASSTSKNTNDSKSSVSTGTKAKDSTKSIWPKYTGEKGQELAFANGVVKIAVSDISDKTATFFNTTLPGNKKIYFFVVKDKNGIYRAAGNACQVCYDAKMGFRQVGNNMVCNTCGNAYPLEKIATEKGGCNTVPINPNLEPVGGFITIPQVELVEVVSFFN